MPVSRTNKLLQHTQELLQAHALISLDVRVYVSRVRAANGFALS